MTVKINADVQNVSGLIHTTIGDYPTNPVELKIDGVDVIWTMSMIGTAPADGEVLASTMFLGRTVFTMPVFPPHSFSKGDHLNSIQTVRFNEIETVSAPPD